MTKASVYVCVSLYVIVHVNMFVCLYARHLLGCILAQLLVSHEELLSLPEGLADGVALVDSLDGGSGDVLDGRYGESAVLQHELSHLTVSPQQSVVQGGVPARQKTQQWVILGPVSQLLLYCFLYSAIFVNGSGLTSPRCAPCD